MQVTTSNTIVLDNCKRPEVKQTSNPLFICGGMHTLLPFFLYDVTNFFFLLYFFSFSSLLFSSLFITVLVRIKEGLRRSSRTRLTQWLILLLLHLVYKFCIVISNFLLYLIYLLTINILLLILKLKKLKSK